MKISKFSILLTLILLCIQNNLWAYKEEEISLFRKDPFLAGALSFYNPGLGQFYVGESRKGTLFWLGENLLFFSAILTVMDMSFKLKKDFGFEFRIQQKSNLSNERIIASIGLGITFIVLHIYNIFDAVESAKEYNKNLEKKLFSLDNASLGISLSHTNAMFYIGHKF